MAELVEERHDVHVLHEPGIVRLAAGEVADERALRQLHPACPSVNREVRGVAEFARPRMEVEVEPPQEAVPS